MVWYSHLLQNLPQFIVIHTVKGFGIVNKAEIDVFLELSCFFHDPADVGPFTSWQIDGETVETVADFIFLGSKITADGDCSHEVKRRLLLGRKVMTNLDSIFKSRDITLPTKVRPVKAMVFLVVMYGCESWTLKKVERRRIDAFKTVVLEKILASPLDCKEIRPVHPKGNQSWVFIGRTDVDAETPILWPPDAKS